jgi:hypothetical protein
MPGGEKTYKVKGEVYNIPESESGSFLKDFPEATEIKSYVAGKDTFDIPVQEVPNFLKEVKDAKEIGAPEPPKPSKPIPSADQQTPDIGIKPVGTYQHQPVNHELPATKGDVASLPGVPSEHKIKQQETAQTSIKTAIDNSVRQKTDKLRKTVLPLIKTRKSFTATR